MELKGYGGSTHLGPFSNPVAPPYEMPLSLIIFGCTNELRSSPSRARLLLAIADEMDMSVDGT